MFMRHRARRMERRMTRAASLGVAAGTGAMAGSMAGKQHTQASEQRSRNNVSKGSFKDVPKKAGAVRENIKDMPIQASYAVHSVGRQAKESVSDFKRGIVQEREHRQSGREEKRQQHRQTIADKRMALQKMQEQSGNHQTHERPATVSKENLSENRSKVQQVRRPIRSAGTPIRKEPQKVTVENMEKTRPLSSYEKNSRNKNDVGNVRSTKSQVHKETNRKVVSKKGQKKK